MKERLLADERGNAWPFIIAVMFVLLSLLSFVIDSGIAYGYKTFQEKAVDASRNQCMMPSFALVVKNSENPGYDIACSIASGLRDEGFAGEIRVWFYEAPNGSIPPGRRVWTVGIQLEQDVPTVVGKCFGNDSIHVASKKILTVEPYTDGIAWRPNHDSSGLYRLKAGEDTSGIVYERISSIDGYPEEIAEQAQASETSANAE